MIPWHARDRLARGECPLHGIPFGQIEGQDEEELDGYVFVLVGCPCGLLSWWMPEFGLFEIAAPFGNLIAAGRA